MANRPDYNGECFTHSSVIGPWFLIDKGVRRGIPYEVKDKLQRPGRYPGGVGVRTEVDIEGIDLGPDWPPDTMIIGHPELSTRWVFEGGMKRGIPSGEIHDAYAFPRGAAVVILPRAVVESIRDHPMGEIEPEGPLGG